MRKVSSFRVRVVLACGLLVACSGGSTHAPPGDAAAGTGGHGGGGAGGAAAVMTCQDIRICAGMAKTDAEVQACIGMGTAAAQQTFRDLEACRTSTQSMAANCASDIDFNCVCREECQADGYCLAAAETCLAGTVTDLFCNGPCTP